MISDNIKNLREEINDKATLLVVSKFRSIEELNAVYETGQRDFAENRVQELKQKQAILPKDIRWHMIGHLQSNKVKYIAPYIHLIHSVDSFDLAAEIDKQALKNNRVIPILIQARIAKEESKYGIELTELPEICKKVETLKNIKLQGLMGMATLSSDEKLISEEFKLLKTVYDNLSTSILANNPDFKILSMGMSSDYKIAIDSGSNMLRIGSAVFEK